MNHTQQKTLLLVEDEALLAMATAQKLKRFGYDVVTAHSGEQAVQIATAQTPIHLILMDINLGGELDGTEAAQQILAVQQIPIVFLTSHMEETYVSKVKTITRYGYVIKNSGDFVLKSSIDMAFELFSREQRIEHVNNVLRAIRNVNQLITHETDSDVLIQKACELLIETRGYHNSWIVLLDEDGTYLTSVQAGLGSVFAPMESLLNTENWTTCGKNALKNTGLVITENPITDCHDCPLSHHYANRGAYTMQLAHQGRLYGLLSVSIPTSCINDTEEHDLFEEVVGDLAFALSNIEREHKRKQQEQEYADLFHTTNEAILKTDANGHITAANRAASDLSGYASPDELLGLPMTALYATPETRPATIRKLQEDGGEFHNFEFLLKRKDGAIVWTLCNITLLRNKEGECIGTLGAIRDIADRKQAEDALRMKDMAIESSLNAIAMSDLSGMLTYVNPQFLKLWGYADMQEVIGRPAIDFWQTQKEPTQVIDALRTQGSWQGEMTAKKHDGLLFDVELSASMVFDHTQTPLCMLASFVNITERKKAEDALREANDTKDRFFSIIAHDLKNPFIAFQSGITMLNEHFQDSDDDFAHDISVELQKKSHHLSELLDKLLTWARMQQGAIPYRPEILDLAVPVLCTANLLRENADHKHLTVTCLITEGTMAYADYNMVEAIVRNLLSNAIKFTNDGGTITVESHDAGDVVEIAVIDTGMGISDTKQHRLFTIGEKNITQVGTAGETGTGLGLILCKEFVEQHGGTIWVESDVGKGSTLTFTLPKAEQ